MSLSSMFPRHTSPATALAFLLTSLGSASAAQACPMGFGPVELHASSVMDLGVPVIALLVLGSLLARTFRGTPRDIRRHRIVGSLTSLCLSSWILAGVGLAAARGQVLIQPELLWLLATGTSTLVPLFLVTRRIRHRPEALASLGDARLYLLPILGVLGTLFVASASPWEYEDFLFSLAAGFGLALPVFTLRRLVATWGAPVERRHDVLRPGALLTARGVDICQVCGEETEPPVRDCVSCGAAHHDDCWEYNGGCASTGCILQPR